MRDPGPPVAPSPGGFRDARRGSGVCGWRSAVPGLVPAPEHFCPDGRALLSRCPGTFVPLRPSGRRPGLPLRMSRPPVGSLRAREYPRNVLRVPRAARTTHGCFCGCQGRQKPPVERSAGGGGGGNRPQKPLRAAGTAAVPPAGPLRSCAPPSLPCAPVPLRGFPADDREPARAACPWGMSPRAKPERPLPEQGETP